MSAAPDHQALRAVISNRVLRNRLITHLLPVSADLAAKLRFCAAVDEFERVKDKVEKKQKGRKIVCTFVENGSLFNIKGVPAELERELTLGKSPLEPNLSALEAHVLAELSQNQLVMDFVESVKQELPPPVPAPAQGLKRVPSKLEVWSNEFYDTVISPVLSPLLGAAHYQRDSANTLKPPALVLNDEMRELEAVLEDKMAVHRLIVKLASSADPQLSVKVRLCRSVLEYNKISERRYGLERKAKGRKIVAVFIQPGSLFCVKSLPPALVAGLTALGEEQNLDLLDEVKLFLYDELLRDQTVRNEIRDALNGRND